MLFISCVPSILPSLLDISLKKSQKAFSSLPSLMRGKTIPQSPSTSCLGLCLSSWGKASVLSSHLVLHVLPSDSAANFPDCSRQSSRWAQHFPGTHPSPHPMLWWGTTFSLGCFCAAHAPSSERPLSPKTMIWYWLESGSPKWIFCLAPLCTP